MTSNANGYPLLLIEIGPMIILIRRESRMHGAEIIVGQDRDTLKHLRILLPILLHDTATMLTLA